MGRSFKVLVLLLLMTIAAGLLLRHLDPDGFSEITGKVRYVVDGDTLHLTTYEPPIRLWGVDAPERNEPGFVEATKMLEKLAKGKELRCEGIDRDKYNRTVARCYLKDGLEINHLMIKSGAVSEYYFYTLGYYQFLNKNFMKKK